MINFNTLNKLKSAKEQFISNHPKFPRFLKTAKDRVIKEGSIIEIKITSPDGEEISSNIKIKKSDMDALNSLFK